MKKTCLFMAALVTASFGFATGTLRTGGSFLENEWRTGSSYITPTSATIATTNVTLTAVPELGYGIYGWYYWTQTYNSQNIPDNPPKNLSDWTALSDNGGDKTVCTIPAESPFASSQTPYPVNYIALNLRYVRYSLSFNYNGGSGASSSMTGLCVTNSVTLPVPEQRDGYDFVKWKGENGSEFVAGRAFRRCGTRCRCPR